MTGINITNKKKLAGRNIKAHIARKLSMPFPAAVDDIKDDYPDIKRSKRRKKWQVARMLQISFLGIIRTRLKKANGCD